MWTDSDSYDDCYVLSDDGLAEYEKQKREEEEKRKRLEMDETKRRINSFENYLTLNLNQSDSIFSLVGFDFEKFNPESIKIKIYPNLMAKYISLNRKYRIVLKYVRNYWYISGCSRLPSDLKKYFYKWLSRKCVCDEEIEELIKIMHEQFEKWAIETSEFAFNRFNRYRNGEEVYLISDEEEMFLSETERKRVREKRDAIWKRMLPPKKK